jgi:hypothetical protein
LTRILTFYEDNLLAAHATVLLLLSLGKEEETLGAALDTVEVVVHVEQTDGESEGGNDDTVHLARDESVRRDENSENHLNDSELGDSGHLEARLGGLDLRSGLGLGILGRVSNGHFIIS